MANYITKQIASKLAVNPKTLTMNGNVPILQHLGTMNCSWLCFQWDFMICEVAMWVLYVESGWLKRKKKKKNKTLGFKAHFLTNHKPQRSCPEMEYCRLWTTIWSDLRHFLSNARMHRVSHALVMQQVIKLK